MKQIVKRSDSDRLDRPTPAWLGVAAWLGLTTMMVGSVSADPPFPTDLYRLRQGDRIRFTLPDESQRIDVRTPNVIGIFLPNPKTVEIRGENPGHCLVVVQFKNGNVVHAAFEVLEAVSPSGVSQTAAQIRKNLAGIPGLSVTSEGPRVVIRGTIAPSNRDLYRSIIKVYGNLVVDQVKFQTAKIGSTYDVFHETFQGYTGDLLITDKGRYELGRLSPHGRCIRVAQHYAICTQPNGRLALVLTQREGI